MSNKTTVEVTVNTEREKSNIVQIAEQIKKGELPSNEQIKAELDPAKELLLEKEKSAQSNQEAQVMHTTRKLVESVQETIEAKNPNDRIQKLTAAVARVAARTVPANSPHGLVRETTEFVNALRDLVFDLAKSKEFRIALLDFFKLMRDVFKFQQKKAENKMEEKGTKDKAEEAFIEGKPMEAGAQVVEDTKQVLQELKIEDLPEDQKQRFRENLRALMNELKNHSDASFAFRKFMRLCSLLNVEFSAHLARAQVDADIKEIQDLSIDLISDLAGGRPVANFIAAVQKAIDKIQQDKELHNYLAECRDHINRGLENPELIAEESYFNQAIELIKRGRAFAERYKNSNTFENLINETQELIEAIKTDDNWSNIQYRANKVAESLTYTDMKGEKHIDFDLIGAMRRELVPFLIDRIKEVPVPGFRIENDDFEYLIVDELYVQIDDILPDKISIHARNDTDLSIKDFENPVKSESVVKFKMEGLRPAFKDMHFSFKRKGVVKLTDEGRANMKITGKGLSIYMDFDIDVDANNRAMLGKFKVQLKMDRVSIDITEAEHKILLNMLTTFFAPRVQKEIEASIKGRVEAIGGEWAMYINKRVLSTIPLPNLGQTVTKAIFP